MSIQDAALAALAVFAATTIQTPDGQYPLPVVMVAVAGAESGWRNDARGDRGLTDRPSCDGYTSFGLWQINTVHGAYLTQASGSSDPCRWAQWLYDPYHNAWAARALLGDRPQENLRHWTAWRTGAYRRYLLQAQAAVLAAAPPAPPAPAPAPIPVPAAYPAWQLAVTSVLLLVGALFIGMALTQREATGNG